MHAFVDCKPLLRDHWRQAAVDVSGVVDDDECGPRAEPLAVAASRRECGLTREVAAWIGARELRSRGRRVAAGVRGECGICGGPHGVALICCERLVVAWRDVTPVAEQSHELVIAEHDVQCSARGGCLALETHDELHDGTRLGAAVEQIAEADDMGGARGPAHVGIDDACRAQELDEAVVRSVDVGERDDSGVGRETPGLLAESGGEQQRCGSAREQSALPSRPRELHVPGVSAAPWRVPPKVHRRE